MAPVRSRPVVPVTRTNQSMTTRSQVLNSELDPAAKRKAASSPEKIIAKRSAFGDITNASGKLLPGKKYVDRVASTTKKLANAKIDDRLDLGKKSAVSKLSVSSKSSQESLKKYVKIIKPTTTLKSKVTVSTAAEKKEVSIKAYLVNKKAEKKGDIVTVAKVPRDSTSSADSCSSRSTASESSLYITASEDSSVFKPDVLPDEFSRVNPDKTPKLKLPNGVEDFDAENWRDPFQVSLYAMDIFNYFKTLEKKFKVKDYMDKQPDLTRGMRAIVVDWMVEVQESFELNHETLYLAVKMMDLYLFNTPKVTKEKLQLIAAASVFVASKYDERMPPAVEDFLFICDGAYSQAELMGMEIKIIKAMDFNLGMPLSYRYLRRYARCAKISMPTLTLARFILEVSLMDYSFVSESESKMAAATLLLAVRMKNACWWTPTLEYYSGYKIQEIRDIACRLNVMLHKNTPSLQTIRNKYSHKIFFEVAKHPLLEKLDC